MKLQHFDDVIKEAGQWLDSGPIGKIHDRSGADEPMSISHTRHTFEL